MHSILFAGIYPQNRGFVLIVNSDESEQKSTALNTRLLCFLDCNGRLMETWAAKTQADSCADVYTLQPQARVVKEAASETAITAPTECDFAALIDVLQL